MSWEDILKGKVRPYKFHQYRNHTLEQLKELYISLAPINAQIGWEIEYRESNPSLSGKQPEQYNKIKNITDLLERMNIKINRENILGELIGTPTNADNEAIEYRLKEVA